MTRHLGQLQAPASFRGSVGGDRLQGASVILHHDHSRVLRAFTLTMWDSLYRPQVFLVGGGETLYLPRGQRVVGASTASGLLFWVSLGPQRTPAWLDRQRR